MSKLESIKEALEGVTTFGLNSLTYGKLEANNLQNTKSALKLHDLIKKFLCQNEQALKDLEELQNPAARDSIEYWKTRHALLQAQFDKLRKEVEWQPIEQNKVEPWKDYLLCDYAPAGLDIDGDEADEKYIVYQGYYSPSDGGRDMWLTVHGMEVHPIMFKPLPQPPKGDR